MLDLNGVYTALITPFYEDGSINYQKLEELIEFQIEKGISGLVFGGTTGEGMLINDLLTYYKTAISLVRNRVKVLLTIFEFGKNELTNIINQLNQLNFDGYLINTPYYLNTSQNGIIKYYEYIDSIVNKPFIVYYNPSRSNQFITLKTWSYIIELNNFIGVKDASLNSAYNVKLMNLLKHKFYFTGNDSMYYQHLLTGSNGIISSLSNAIPDVFVKIYFLYKNEEYLLSSKIYKKYSSLISIINVEPNPIGIKYFMNILGFNVGKPLFPLIEYSTLYQNKLKDIYKELKNENINYW